MISSPSPPSIRSPPRSPPARLAAFLPPRRPPARVRDRSAEKPGEMRHRGVCFQGWRFRRNTKVIAPRNAASTVDGSGTTEIEDEAAARVAGIAS